MSNSHRSANEDSTLQRDQRLLETFPKIRSQLSELAGQFLETWVPDASAVVRSSTRDSLIQIALVTMRSRERNADWTRYLQALASEPPINEMSSAKLDEAGALWLKVLLSSPMAEQWEATVHQDWSEFIADVLLTLKRGRSCSIPMDELAELQKIAATWPSDSRIVTDRRAVPIIETEVTDFLHSFDLPAATSDSRRPLPTESNPMSLDIQQEVAVSAPIRNSHAAQFYGVIEHLSVAVMCVTSTRQIFHLNQQAQQLFRQLADEIGAMPEELVGDSLDRLEETIPGLIALTTSRKPGELKVILGTETLCFRSSAVLGSDGKRWGTAFHISNITDSAGDRPRLIESLKDQRALLDVLTALERARTDEEAIRIALDSVRECFGWAYGSYWRLNHDENYLEFALESGSVTAEFRRITEQATFAQGIGLSGRTWKQRELIFVDDLSKVTDCVRAPAARKAGVKSGVCFPIEVHNELIGTMDFFSLETLELSPERRETLQGVGRVVSQTIGRLRELQKQQRSLDEITRIQNMMDNLPINVIMATRDSTIVYMNPATMRTLKTIEHLLPVPAEQLKGQSFDILHKSPEVQRRIVSDPKNLPHRARIQLGPETLDLLVSAITDRNGEYTGPMVTWSVITGSVKIADDFERDVKSVVEMVTSSALEMQAGSRNLAASSEQTARQSQVVAAASDEATRNVETVSSAAEELSKSIAEIARHVQEASKMTSNAVNQADRTNVTIKQLGDSSNEIGQVVKVITSIAQQTNLLALNATIEAARAGEAGKGFAVVANEVKELARQTAKATEEISQKISAIQGATGIAVSAIGGISDSIRKINEISETIASAVEEQTAATNEISRNVAEAARGTAEVSLNIAGVSQAADEGGRGASDILAASEGLAQESARLDRVTSVFLERLRQM